MPVTVQKWAGYISLLARFSTKVEGVCGSVIMGESVTMRGREDGRVCVMVLDAKARLGLLLLRNSADFKSAFVRSFLDVILLKTEVHRPSSRPPEAQTSIGSRKNKSCFPFQNVKRENVKTFPWPLEAWLEFIFSDLLPFGRDPTPSPPCPPPTRPSINAFSLCA